MKSSKNVSSSQKPFSYLLSQTGINDQVTSAETATLLELAEKCLSLPGDFAELGCYRGDTSVLLGQLLQQNFSKTSSGAPQKTSSASGSTGSFSSPKHLWLYDSFAGLPEKTGEDSSGAGVNFQAGELLVSKREVVDKLQKHGLKTSSHPLSDYSTVIVKKAWFNELQSHDLPPEIAFAFLDGDLYSSIKTSLKLVAPRLQKQGIMVVHDYNNPELPGSARAVDEWLRIHPDFTMKRRHSLAILTRVC